MKSPVKSRSPRPSSGKHPARRGAVLGQTDRERLTAGEVLGVARIAQPGERVGDDVNKIEPASEAGRGFLTRRDWRATTNQTHDERARYRQLISGSSTGALMKIQDNIGNEQRDQRHRNGGVK